LNQSYIVKLFFTLQNKSNICHALCRISAALGAVLAGQLSSVSLELTLVVAGFVQLMAGMIFVLVKKQGA
jgi:hypothetical protein